MLDYETIPLHWVNRLGFLVRKELGQLFMQGGYDVSPEEWAVLLLLWRDTSKTPGDIAAVTFRDRTTVTRLIDGMVSKGLVFRDMDPSDRRKSVVKATDRGNDLEQELVPIARGLIARALNGIDPGDVETTVRSLRTMTRNLSSERDRHKTLQQTKEEDHVQL
ncbi:MAG: MarR family transcriptional regulator [Alphaproteobacteria bacterium]|nr:MarR family transcriptional regulator [Alphaproteobacteria bacterium]